MEKSKQPPAWFADIIIDGLKGLYTLIPPSGRPASDQMANTTRIWINTIWNKPVMWAQDLDSARLSKAWDIVYSEVTEWITPAQYMDRIPHRPQQLALPKPEYPREKARENIEQIRKMLRGTIKPIPR